MNNKNIKVVDEHNIDRNANVMFGFDLEGSEYVSYWIERDIENSNIFISKVIKNIDGSLYSEKDDIKEILANHIISSVRFDKAMQVMDKENIDTSIEVGPGKTMIGFVKKELREKDQMDKFIISQKEQLLIQKI